METFDFSFVSSWKRWAQVHSLWIHLKNCPLTMVMIIPSGPKSFGNTWADALVLWSFFVDNCRDSFLGHTQLCDSVTMCFLLIGKDHVMDLVSGLLCDDSDHRMEFISLCPVWIQQPTSSPGRKQETLPSLLPPCFHHNRVGPWDRGSRWLHRDHFYKTI